MTTLRLGSLTSLCTSSKVQRRDGVLELEKLRRLQLPLIHSGAILTAAGEQDIDARVIAAAWPSHRTREARDGTALAARSSAAPARLVAAMDA